MRCQHLPGRRAEPVGEVSPEDAGAADEYLERLKRIEERLKRIEARWRR